MTIMTFLRDRKLFFLLNAAGLAFVLYLLYLTQQPIPIFLLVLLCWAGPVAMFAAYEYRRSYRFYRQLEQQFAALEQKYFLAEVVEEPDFVEGAFIFNILQQTNQAMYEHLRHYRQQNREYQEYIELWVHEIKLPIAAAKLTLDNSPNSKEKTNLHLELQRIENYIEQVLYFARINEAAQSFLLRPVSLATTIQQVIQQHARVFIYRKIKIELSETLEREVITDQKWLEFILNQIIGNALKYTAEETGKITIAAQDTAEGVRLEIRDNGIGIAAQDLKRVFEKGYTGENGHHLSKSTGMGLYISKKLAETLAIHLEITSSLHQGTTVTLVFPSHSEMPS